MPLQLDKTTHTYTLDGRTLPGVTAVLTDVGAVDTTWFTPEARRRGQIVHRACRLLLEDDLDEDSLSPGLKGYIAAFKRFLTETGFKAKFIEHKVHGINHAGTLDWYGVMHGAAVLIDGKSGAVPKWCRLQTAAYAQALQHCEGALVEKRFGLQLKPDGKYALSEAYTNLADFEYWDACLRVYHGKRSGWAPMVTHAAPTMIVTETTEPPAPTHEVIVVSPDAGERIVLCEQITALLKERAPGPGSAAGEARKNLLERHFGDRSWLKVERMPPADLRQGLESLKAAAKPRAVKA